MSSAASSRADVKTGAGQPVESNPEFQLLLGCTFPTHTLRIAGPVNWDRVFQLAHLHGVIPQLGHALEKSEADVSPAVLDRIRTENRNNTRQALWLTREMFRI